jgi:hypothetical protein
MLSFSRQFIFLILLVFLSSCGSSYPFGIPEKEWDGLSVTEKVKLRKQEYGYYRCKY